MSKLFTAIKLIKENKADFCASLLENLNFLFSDKLYLQLLFRCKFGRKLNLKNPKSFNEKLQWLKLYNRDSIYTTLVDKYSVKNHVAKILGEKCIVPTLGVWDDVETLNIDMLPNQFVLKTTNGGGGGDVLICKDKSQFDLEKAKKILKRSLKKNIYKKLREWPYKNVYPRIIAEKFLDDNGHVPVDYKVYCFNGEPYKVMLCLDRDKDEPTKFYSFDFNWNLLRHNIMGKMAPEGFTLPKPKSLEQMRDCAKLLSKEIPFVRVDFYDLNGHMYFGEMTFYPDSGFDSAILPEIDQLYGSMIDLKRYSGPSIEPNHENI
jgi:hypothetical protein